jgi:trans-aconitate methyltransferase
MKSFQIDNNDVKEQDFELKLPEVDRNLPQDQEWCVVLRDNKEEYIRFHDYNKIFAVPGLYEQLFYETLECCSPTVVCDLLERTIETSLAQVAVSDLTVLDVGAGNGMVGEELQNRGVVEVVGVDLIPEAAEAAERDRPGVYSEYFVEDLTEMSNRSREQLEGKRFNCLTTVAALGFGDIPPEAFTEAFNLVDDNGWLAFNIWDKFLETTESTGFSRLIERMIGSGVLEGVNKKKYRHRLSMTGEPIYYYAFAARKVAAIPAEWWEDVEESVA